MILAYISKILKNYFWKDNILFNFNIRIKNLKGVNIQNIIRDNNYIIYF
jgi:hypothetical protein